MARAATDHLRDALEALAAIRTYTRKGRREFDGNPMLRDAVAARLMQIGQAVKDAQAEGLDLPRLAPATPWQAIAGMRDRLAHRYWRQDTNLVRAVVERDLPQLRDAIESVLRTTSR